MKSKLKLKSYKFIYLDRDGNELCTRIYRDHFYTIGGAREFAAYLLSIDCSNTVKIKVRRIYE